MNDGHVSTLWTGIYTTTLFQQNHAHLLFNRCGNSSKTLTLKCINFTLKFNWNHNHFSAADPKAFRKDLFNGRGEKWRKLGDIKAVTCHSERLQDMSQSFQTSWHCQ